MTGPTIACVDVHYGQTEALASCVLLRNWSDDRPSAEVIQPVPHFAAYEPGKFYRRELPCLLAVLGRLTEWPAVIVVDGYVWLGDGNHPGLGAHLYAALGGASVVIGVAKKHFHGGPSVRNVTRGMSVRPLYVTAVGIDVNDAADRIRNMHGPFRIPSLLRRTDRLCRSGIGST